MKEIAVFGLGTLGKSLAISYSNMGGKVIAIDKSQEKVDEISDYVTFAIRADLTEENVIKGLGVANVDVAIVTIGENFEASIIVPVAIIMLSAVYSSSPTTTVLLSLK